jgi:hypothetical protein
MLVVIGTDCIDSCKSNYQMITTTRAPNLSGNESVSEYNADFTFFFSFFFLQIINLEKFKQGK